MRAVIAMVEESVPTRTNKRMAEALEIRAPVVREKRHFCKDGLGVAL